MVTTDPIYGSKHLDTVSSNDDASVLVVSYDIFDPRHCTIDLWVSIQTLPGAFAYFLGFGDVTDSIRIGLNASNYWYLIYEANGVSEAVNGIDAAVVGKQYHIRAVISDSNNNGIIKLWVNGSFIGYDTVGNAWGFGGTGTLYFGSRFDGGTGIDVFMDQITISKNTNTPQNWTAFGKPLWRPLIQVS